MTIAIVLTIEMYLWMDFSFLISSGTNCGLGTNISAVLKKNQSCKHFANWFVICYVRKSLINWCDNFMD